MIIKKLSVYLLIALHSVLVAAIVFGSVLVPVWPSFMWLHFALIAWAFCIEIKHWSCPLTLWENQLRVWADLPCYQDGFIGHYYLKPIFGSGNVRRIELPLTCAVVFINVVVYLFISL